MDWGRIKGVLTVLLILANVIVGCLSLNLRNSKYSLPDGTAEAVVENLSRRGIKLEKTAVNLEKPKFLIYTGKSSDSEKMKNKLEDIAELFVGKSDESPVYLSTPEGVSLNLTSRDNMAIVTVENNINFSGTSSNVTEFATIEELFEVCSEPMEYAKNVTVASEQRKKIAEFYGAASSTENVNGAVTLGYECLSNVTYKEGNILSVVQTLDGVMIPELSMRFVFTSDNELVYADGALFFGNVKKAYSEKLLDGVNAIYKLDLSSVSEIYGEYFAYSPIRIEEEKYYFVPGWAIDTVTQNGSRRIMVTDGLSGEQKTSFVVSREDK